MPSKIINDYKKLYEKQWNSNSKNEVTHHSKDEMDGQSISSFLKLSKKEPICSTAYFFEIQL